MVAQSNQIVAPVVSARLVPVAAMLVPVVTSLALAAARLVPVVARLTLTATRLVPVAARLVPVVARSPVTLMILLVLNQPVEIWQSVSQELL